MEYQKEGKGTLGTDGKFSVMEIFRTVQGEGLDIGRETIFMRLAVCNLRCGWCDTKDSWTKSGEKESLTIDEIIERFHNLDPAHELSHYVITGGEPLLHNHDLLAELMERLAVEGWRYGTFETNGTVIPNPRLQKATWLFSVSPKLSSSGNGEYPSRFIDEWLKIRSISLISSDWARKGVQFKLVVADINDAREVARLIKYCNSHIPFIIQPEESANNYRELPALMGRAFSEMGTTKLNENIRYIPQVHKMTGWR
jgi:organic radical activating enzyme